MISTIVLRIAAGDCGAVSFAQARDEISIMTTLMARMRIGPARDDVNTAMIVCA